MELEEAIKKLQLMEYKYTLTENDDRAIEVVLDNLSNKNKRIIRLAKIIKELEQENYKLDRENQKLFEININSISKKKIEDRIKELEHLIEEVKDVVGLGFDCIEYKGAIKILQELLEDK